MYDRQQEQATKLTGNGSSRQLAGRNEKEGMERGRAREEEAGPGEPASVW